MYNAVLMLVLFSELKDNLQGFKQDSCVCVCVCVCVCAHMGKCLWVYLCVRVSVRQRWMEFLV